MLSGRRCHCAEALTETACIVTGGLEGQARIRAQRFLRPLPVRPAWGKGFLWGGFWQHLFDEPGAQPRLIEICSPNTSREWGVADALPLDGRRILRVCQVRLLQHSHMQHGIVQVTTSIRRPLARRCSGRCTGSWRWDGPFTSAQKQSASTRRAWTGAWSFTSWMWFLPPICRAEPRTGLRQPTRLEAAWFAL